MTAWTGHRLLSVEVSAALLLLQRLRPAHPLLRQLGHLASGWPVVAGNLTLAEQFPARDTRLPGQQLGGRVAQLACGPGALAQGAARLRGCRGVASCGHGSRGHSMHHYRAHGML